VRISSEKGHSSKGSAAQPQLDQLPPFVKPDVCAALLQERREFVDELAEKGILTKIPIGPGTKRRHYRVPRADLLRLIQSGEVTK